MFKTKVNTVWEKLLDSERFLQSLEDLDSCESKGEWWLTAKEPRLPYSFPKIQAIASINV